MRILLGVTGCIGAYKSALILRLLQKEGFDVEVVMTKSAQAFLGPLTLEKLSGRRVLCDLMDSSGPEITHIAAARRNQLLLVAPATANILAKFAAGVADDLLSTIYLSTTAPVMVAPAMNVEMWKHPVTQRNLKLLAGDDVMVVSPGAGYQACGETGEGRLAEPEDIVAAVRQLLARRQSLAGVRVLVTAGPTIEDIDPVRFLSNRSSGRMGFALAVEAGRRGAEVTLVAGPSSLETPERVERIDVRSASDMAEAVLERFDAVDVVVKAAAVADYTPVRASDQKLPKQEEDLTVRLARTPDILQLLVQRRKKQLLVGFAAESDQLRTRAVEKLERKQLDMIVANDILSPDAGFDVETNRALLLDRLGAEEELPLMTKAEMAIRIWDRIESLRQRLEPEPETVPQVQNG